MQAAGGLPPEAVAGQIKDIRGDISPENFVSNMRFLEFLHSVISAAAPKDPDYLAAARAQGNGWLCIIDLRTPEGLQGNVPFEDMIAAFEVRDGCLVAGSYWGNEEYRVV